MCDCHYQYAVCISQSNLHQQVYIYITNLSMKVINGCIIMRLPWVCFCKCIPHPSAGYTDFFFADIGKSGNSQK